MNKGYLFLAGGGSSKTSFDFDEKYLALLKSGSSILYSPAAMEDNRMESCRDWFANMLSLHGRNDDISVRLLFPSEDIPDLSSYDSVYIGGGNTYKLLEYIYSKNMGEKLLEYLGQGGIVYGGSAGAIIWGKDIKTVEEEKEHYSRDNGLDFLSGKSLDCHYTETRDARLIKVSPRIGGEIWALPEDSGIILDSQKHIQEVVGGLISFRDGVKKQLKSSSQSDIDFGL